jgi:hypothetical protein
MDPETIAALGALLTGIGSLIAAILSVRKQKQKDVDICEKRITEIREAFYAGVHFQYENFPQRSG